MKHFSKILILIVALFVSLSVEAQVNQWQDIYKVKKKDTLFGISHKYGITLPELIEANPVMKTEGYELKKGDTIFIPFAKKQSSTQKAANAVNATTATKQSSVVKIGVMLPLHNVDGDGRRMIEYYRGILMACDSLKRAGISTDVKAWNLPIDGNVEALLKLPGASDRDVIFGPLYTHQVKPIGDFCKAHGIRLVVPFSINGMDVCTNSNIFQVYQNVADLNAASIKAFLERFPKHHPVFIDCNDSTSKKGIFTSGLRQQLEKAGIQYSITNLKNSEQMFLKAFSRTQPNVVILNTGRSPELNVALAKLNSLILNVPGLSVSLYGYTEWLMYTKYQTANFHKFNTFIPTTFYYNPLNAYTVGLERAYRRWFAEDMQLAQPRFAITGYDHCQFFVRGIRAFGKDFTGYRRQQIVPSLQSPLSFERAYAPGMKPGGWQNRSFMLIHYKLDNSLESITY